MRPVYSLIFSSILTAVIAITVQTAHAATVNPAVDERPEYVVTYQLSEGLEPPMFTLTDMGFRLLPDYIKTSSALPLGALDERNLVTIHAVNPTKRFCEKHLNFCWPKVIELDGTYARFIDYNGSKRYALDTSNLHRTLWNAYVENFKSTKGLN